MDEERETPMDNAGASKARTNVVMHLRVLNLLENAAMLCLGTAKSPRDAFYDLAAQAFDRMEGAFNERLSLYLREQFPGASFALAEPAASTPKEHP
jgi:hypothetical protein